MVCGIKFGLGLGFGLGERVKVRNEIWGGRDPKFLPFLKNK